MEESLEIDLNNKTMSNNQKDFVKQLLSLKKKYNNKPTKQLIKHEKCKPSFRTKKCPPCKKYNQTNLYNLKRCPPGKKRNKRTNRCNLKRCPPGKILNKLTNKCKQKKRNNQTNRCKKIRK